MSVDPNPMIDEIPPAGDLEESILLDAENAIDGKIQKVQKKIELGKIDDLKKSILNTEE